MTRSFFKGLTIRAVICVILSMTFLFSCLWYTRSVNRSKEQDAYRKEYGTLLLASKYRSLNTDVNPSLIRAASALLTDSRCNP